MERLIAIFLLFVVSVYSSSIYSSNGVGRTFAGDGPGKGWISITGSMEASNAKDRLYQGKFFHVPKSENTNKYAVTPLREVFLNTFRMSLDYGFTSFYDMSVVVPFHQDHAIKVDTAVVPDLGSYNGTGFGDIEIVNRLEFPFDDDSYAIEMAFISRLTIPSGDNNKGFLPKESWIELPDTSSSPSFFSAQSVGLGGGLALTFVGDEIDRGSSWLVHVNSYYHHVFIESGYGAFLNSIALEYDTETYLTLYGEASAQSPISQISDFTRYKDAAIRFSPGFIVKYEKLSFSFGIDYGFQQKSFEELDTLIVDDNPTLTYDNQTWYKVQPVSKWGFHSSVSWSGSLIRFDKDDDGIYNDLDLCPSHPEDLDGYEDEDGCPEVDNDQDGLDDDEDYCPNIPEDIDGVEDTDGCPDDDNDKDGVPDLIDKCPKQKEDYNGYADQDGCPDDNVDQDNDSVEDRFDKCPTLAEDLDGYADKDGCPEDDADNDLFADEVDLCPLEPETKNGFQDDDGCPDEKKIPFSFDAGNVIENINFESGKSTLTDDSYIELEKISDVLVANSQVVVEVSGHTDAYGNYGKNMELSEERAETVVEYLLDQGALEQQLLSKGYGPDKPIASNATKAGRAKNRRIEIIRLK